MAAVTICLPVYNAARYLREAMDGIFAQTFDDWQLIVSDNASTDETREIVASYCDPRIQVFRHETNIGAGPNWQSVMSRVTAPYFCFHAGDDYFLPEHLERRLEILKAYPHSAYAHGAMRVIDAEGRYLGDYVEPLRRYEPRASAAPLFLQRNIVNVAGAVIRTDTARNVGFALNLRYSLLFDWHLFLNLTLHSEGSCYDAVATAAYRKHPESVARQTEGTGRWLIEEKSLQLDSLRESQAIWSEFLDPDAAAAATAKPLWRAALKHLLRHDVRSSRRLWQIFRSKYSLVGLTAAAPRVVLEQARKHWRSDA